MKLKTQFRYAQIRAEDVDQDNRSIRFSFSSENPVERYWGNEVLDHAPSSIRLGRLRDGGPLLNNHRTDEQIGVVDSVEVKSGRAYATVRFSKGAAGQAALDDVRDGIRRNVSVGYSVHRMAKESEKDGVPTFRVDDWEPFEVSLVSVPADTSVGVGRSELMEEREVSITERSDMDEDEKKEAQKKEEKREAPAKKTEVTFSEADVTKRLGVERERIAEITALGEKYRCADDARIAIREGHTLDQFRAHILKDVLKARPAASSTMALEDMERDGNRKYSLSSVVRSIDKTGAMQGFEAEVAQELGKLTGNRSVKGVLIPLGVFGLHHRTLNVAGATAGGYTVDTDLLGSEFVKKLYNPAVVESAGARRITGVTGDLAIPTQTGGVTAYWLPESGTVTDSEAAFGLLVFKPNRLQVSVPWTRQLALQSSLDVEGLIREDAGMAIMSAIDLAAFQGLGADGQPKGLFSYNTGTSGINTVTYSGAATFAKSREAISALLVDNTAQLGTPMFIISPAAWAKWSTAVVDAGSGMFLWQGTHDNGTVGGYPGRVSNHLPSEKAVIGIFSEMLMPFWEGVDVIIDPYSRKKEGIIEMSATIHMDIGVRRTEAFVVSTDSAAA